MRRVAAVGVAGVLIAAVLVLGVRWLEAPGSPVPSAPPTSMPAVGSSTLPGASPSSKSTVGLPDPRRTPGAINPAATQANLAATVCKPGWASKVRPPAAYTGALKIAQILQYGYTDRNPSHYQEDHLVPLELGGAPRDPRNLWPEPNTVVLADGTPVGSKQKDALEDALHRGVCGGQMSLADAQRSIATDWIAAWRAAGEP